MAYYTFFLLLVVGLAGVIADNAELGQRLLYRKPGSMPSSPSKLGIYDGSGTTIQKHASLVSVLYDSGFLCAGNIIGDRWVLLSGDCLYGMEPEYLTVVAGSQDGYTGDSYAVQQVVVHPKYGSSFLDYDYGMLQIENSFKYSNKVKKIPLPKKLPKAGTTTVVSGWGETGSEEVAVKGADNDATLLEGKMHVISQQQCEEAYAGFGLTFTQRMGCLYNQGKTTLCYGDWSDPGVVGHGHGHALNYVFIAIATDGECSSSAYPSIVASVLAAKPWIRNITGIE